MAFDFFCNLTVSRISFQQVLGVFFPFLLRQYSPESCKKEGIWSCLNHAVGPVPGTKTQRCSQSMRLPVSLHWQTGPTYLTHGAGEEGQGCIASTQDICLSMWDQVVMVSWVTLRLSPWDLKDQFLSYPTNIHINSLLFMALTSQRPNAPFTNER